MTVRLDGTLIRLEGRCHVEDAEPLFVLLLAVPGRPVDWSGAETLHTAVVQVLVAFGAPVLGDNRDDFIRRWIAPTLTRVRADT
ncbi:MAG TPA: hypothetical protein VGV37_04550 [Aliidongia sp.]|uniref:hypothetical protein n=1 Tax=Aliidongia sp. TaxID=1914230 RepID=UPI002DDD7A38|nr:hypothetical protein [Aliidongia sp.]HEV2673788.1 hypothetical protein [Aliidongia sp.]